MTRTDRLYALVEELRAAAPGRRTARTLAERFEVSTRTIERDIAALQASGVPIWSDDGRLGGYTIDPASTLPPLGLTVDEALAITVGLGMLARSPFREAATTAVQKILAVQDTDDARRTLALARRISLLGDEGAPAADRPLPPTALAAALGSGRVVRLEYRDKRGAVTTRDVEPLGCIGKSDDWYLIAWCRLRDGVRAFRGDRVVEVAITDERAPRRVVDTADLGIRYGELRPIVD